jgi:dimethylhistidine N-methyltransferase
MITTDVEAFARTFAEDVDRGLSSVPKYLPCIYFYDYQGSVLFEKICDLPEYYLTGAEASILRAYSEEITSHLPPGSALVELGSGSCVKTEYLIEELLVRYGKVTYSPIDISRKMLKESARSLIERYEDLEVISVAAEYREGIRQIEMRMDRPKLILWLGSSIGNFEPDEAVVFLKSIVELLAPEDLFLIGFDLDKEKSILEHAYNDDAGVTARFNLNLLARINRQLEGEFDLDLFRHEAVYNQEKSRVEMFLVSLRDQEVSIADCGRRYAFKKGERIHTENSHKFSLKAIESISRRAGMRIVKQWLDDMEYFCLTLFGPKRVRRHGSGDATGGGGPGGRR